MTNEQRQMSITKKIVNGQYIAGKEYCRGHIEKLVEAVESQAGQDLKPMWDKWHEEMTKQIKETIKGE